MPWPDVDVIFHFFFRGDGSGPETACWWPKTFPTKKIVELKGQFVSPVYGNEVRGLRKLPGKGARVDLTCVPHTQNFYEWRAQMTFRPSQALGLLSVCHRGFPRRRRNLRTHFSCHQRRQNVIGFCGRAPTSQHENRGE